MRTVIDALLRRLTCAAEEAAKPINDEESTGATATQLSRPSSPGDLYLGTT